MRTSATTQAERVAAGPRRRSPAPDDAGASPRPDVSTSPTPGPAPPQGGGTRRKFNNQISYSDSLSAVALNWSISVQAQRPEIILIINMFSPSYASYPHSQSISSVAQGPLICFPMRKKSSMCGCVDISGYFRAFLKPLAALADENRVVRKRQEANLRLQSVGDKAVAGYDVSGATELSKAADSGYVISNLTRVHFKYNWLQSASESVVGIVGNQIGASSRLGNFVLSPGLLSVVADGAAELAN
ncbi:hypothetical protein MG293_010271 [Ovis ammon polii]|uniref:Uncharacterized protein n=1 Tax=Ovis ammon polii TaxID=230172 RepID=A0AAD4YAX8_OVIAM|nr:hypothetical protein MG293_010271 [Ovis ammon polii]